MRKVLFSFISTLVIAILLFLMVGITPQVYAQDEQGLKCSAPIQRATLDVFPESVTLWFNQDVSEAEIKVFTTQDGRAVQVDNGETAVEGDQASVGLNSEALITDARYRVLATVDDTLYRLTFRLSADAEQVEDAEIENDCPEEATAEPTTEAATEVATEAPTEEPTEAPTEVPTEEPTEAPTEVPTEEPTEVPTEVPTEEPTEAPTEAPTEEPTEVPTEEPTEEPTEAPTEEPTEEPTEAPTEEPTEAPTEEASPEPTSLLGEDTVTDVIGANEFSVGVPAEYVSDNVEGYFLRPVVVMAADDDTIEAYIADADAVDQFVIIYTTFGSADLSALGLEEGADNQAIIDALIREDSTPTPAEEVTVAGVPALRVAFANEASGKSGVFYLVAFPGTEEGTTDYLLIQGSAPTEEWPNHEATFQAVVDSIVTVTGEE